MSTRPIGAHQRVYEYDGGFKCLNCLSMWGALHGHASEPPVQCTYICSTCSQPVGDANELQRLRAELAQTQSDRQREHDAAVKLRGELESLRAENAHAKELRDWAAEANTRNARELLEAMGGHPAYSLLDNASRLRAENAKLCVSLIECGLLAKKSTEELIVAEAEIAALQADIERHIKIATELATENAKLNMETIPAWNAAVEAAAKECDERAKAFQAQSLNDKADPISAQRLAFREAEANACMRVVRALKRPSPPRCIGYPDCDGDLPGEPHSKPCPLFTED